MTEIEKCLREHAEKLDTLVGQLQHLSAVVEQTIAPQGPVQPLMAIDDAPVFGTADVTPASTLSGRIRGAIATVNAGNGSGATVQVFMRHPSLPGGQVEMFHGWLASGFAAPVLVAGTHVPQGASFSIVTTNSGSGTLKNVSLAVYIDALPVTGPEILRKQRP